MTSGPWSASGRAPVRLALMLKRLLVAVGVAALLGIGAAGCGDDDAPQRSESVGHDLFVQTASSGSLTPGRGEGRSELVLNGVSPRTTYFTDRPQRRAGLVPVGVLVRKWSEAFGGDPPEAAIQLDDAPKSSDTVVVELLRAPTYRSAARTLAYPVRVVSPDNQRLDPVAARADRRLPTRFSDASLFIDAGGLMQLVAYGAQDIYSP